MNGATNHCEVVRRLFLSLMTASRALSRAAISLSARSDSGSPRYGCCREVDWHAPRTDLEATAALRPLSAHFRPRALRFYPGRGRDGRLTLKQACPWEDPGAPF